MHSDAGNKMSKRKRLDELRVDGRSTEDRTIWKEALQRHCEEAYEDVEETIERQEDRIEKYQREGDRHCTEEGRTAEITIDCVLQARPEDSIVTEMIKQPQEDIYEITTCVQDSSVHDFDVRWDQALSSASEIPTDVIQEGLFKSNLQDSVQVRTVLAMYEQENIRNNEQPSVSRLKIVVGPHVDQAMKTRNFRA